MSGGSGEVPPRPAVSSSVRAPTGTAPMTDPAATEAPQVPASPIVQVPTGALTAFAKFAGVFFIREKPARWLALGLLLLTLLQIGIQIRFNLWGRDFFNALENRDRDGFLWQMVLFLGLAAASMITAVYQLYVKQLTQLRWRQWLTERLLGEWMNDARHYQMEKAGQSDANPDQRIAEDARITTEMAVDFATGLFNASVMLCAFIGILWTISGALRFNAFGTAVEIPGYMVWAALIYALVGSTLTYFVGRPMVRLHFARASREAEFRFGLVRARESSEGIALIGGERDERRGLGALMGTVAGATKELMQSQRRLMWLTSAYGMLTGVFPTVVAAPSYFSGAITLGGLMQIGSAFGSVQASLNWFVDNFPKLAEWRSAVERLLNFQEGLNQIEGLVRDPDQPTLVRTEGAKGEAEAIRFRDVQVAFPTGSVVIAEATAEILPGERVLIKGESGTGKSTLFRAFAGVWPWGSGEIRMPPRDATMFMPQRPYLPLGSLRTALAYPAGPSSVSDAVAREALDTVGLVRLMGKIDFEDRWDQTLSLGEQQRLAFARLLIQKPRWIFMDEATAALDEENQDAMMRLVTERLSGSALVSIGHRPGLEAFHDRTLNLQRGPEGAKLAMGPRRQIRARRIRDRLRLPRIRGRRPASAG